MRILFMGSPELAVPSLQAVREVGQIVGVVTQPPRGKGRGRKRTPSPVARTAEDWNVRIMTPDTVRSAAFVEEISGLAPDVAVVVAYGKILPPDVLAAPRLGCVNVHASLLPELRGAAPIQWAVARGYTETGVTLMQMDEGMDTGPILLQRQTAVEEDETAEELGRRLSVMGADLLREGLPLLGKGALPARAQDDSLATYAPLLTKEDGRIDWTDEAAKVAAKVRGFSPWPGTYTTLEGGRLLVTKARTLAGSPEAGPGTVTFTGPEGIHVSCGGGTLHILCVKPEGRREMAAGEYLAGHRLKPGDILGQ